MAAAVAVSGGSRQQAASAASATSDQCGQPVSDSQCGGGTWYRLTRQQVAETPRHHTATRRVRRGNPHRHHRRTTSTTVTAPVVRASGGAPCVNGALWWWRRCTRHATHGNNLQHTTRRSRVHVPRRRRVRRQRHGTPLPTRVRVQKGGALWFVARRNLARVCVFVKWRGTEDGRTGDRTPGCCGGVHFAGFGPGVKPEQELARQATALASLSSDTHTHHRHTQGLPACCLPRRRAAARACGGQTRDRVQQAAQAVAAAIPCGRRWR